MNEGQVPGGAVFSGSSGAADVRPAFPEQAEQMLAVLESCLCELFPSDFYRRCAFAAFGMVALLNDAGISASIIGGQFAAFVMAPDGSRMAVQGFDRGQEPFPHIWVEAEGHSIDLGPYLLPFGSDYPVAPMPALAWNMAAPLPAALRYKVHARLQSDARVSANPAVRTQCDRFVARCREVHADVSRTPRLPNWVATGPASMAAAVGREDSWACGAKRFEQLAANHPLPF